MRKPPSTTTARLGVNYTRSIVEEANCCFQPIEHDNDFGVDALIEVVDGEELSGVMVAVQIKSGLSYCTPTSCTIPIKAGHASYWAKYQLPVVGIVYDPSEAVAYWVDLKSHVARRGTDALRATKFAKTAFNRFDRTGFAKFFIPLMVRRPVVLGVDESIELALGDGGMHRVGLHSLYHAHLNDPKAWQTFMDILRMRPVDLIDPLLVYILAHVPGHGDIAWPSGAFLDSALRSELRGEFAQFGRPELERLLAFVGEEGFERGTLGQSVAAIIDLVGDKARLLRDIASDESVEISRRMSATILVAVYEQNRCNQFLHALGQKTLALQPLVSMLLDTFDTDGQLRLT